MSKAVILGIVAGAALATTALADPVTLFEARLGDHPNGQKNPPGYGLRLDNQFADSGGAGGTTTFSFQENGANVVLKVIEDSGVLTISISGQVYGGEAPGSTYTFGAGLYALDFTMTVVDAGDGWTSVSGADNSGTLSALGDYGLTGPTDFDLELKGGAAMFLFLDDGHRLPGSTGWAGRGWLKGDGTRDFLFTVIPLPGSAALAMAGLGLVAVRRRRAS